MNWLGEGHKVKIKFVSKGYFHPLILLICVSLTRVRLLEILIEILFKDYELLRSIFIQSILVFSIVLIIGTLMGKVSYGMAILVGEIGVMFAFIYKGCEIILELIYKILINKSKIYSPPSSSLLKITAFLYSQQTQKQVFEITFADWQEEYFEALSKKEIWKARWINVRYTYAFLAAMWMKSPIGDLIEFIQKFAK